MGHSFIVLLAVFLVAVGAQDLDVRTYGSYYHHSHAVPHPGHHAHTHGHHNHGRPVHHHGHAPHPHVHAQHPVPSHAGHQHPAIQPTSDVVQSILQAQNIQHPSHHHQHSSVPSQVASNVKTVPVMVCRLIQVPVARRGGSSHVTKRPSSSSGPQHMFRNITASISNVVGRVVHPVVSLLQSAPGWFNRTTPSDHGTHHHRQHNFTVLNHTAYHPQSHHVRPHPHHQRRNFTAPKVNDVQKKLPSPGDVNPHRTCPFSRDASGPAASTEAPATAVPTPAVTTTLPHAVTTTGNPTTVGVPVLHSRLCGQVPAVPALRAYPFATAYELATSIDGSTSEKLTSQVPQDIINATGTILPTTPTGGSVYLLEDRAEVTASTSAAATLLAASHTPLVSMPTGNETAGSTYMPASDTTSWQPFAPSTTSVVHTTAPSPITVPLLKGTQTALPATRHLPTTPPSEESTSVVPQGAPDATPFGKAPFTWSPRRFA